MPKPLPKTVPCYLAGRDFPESPGTLFALHRLISALIAPSVFNPYRPEGGAYRWQTIFITLTGADL